jgi:hypothetical protein
MEILKVFAVSFLVLVLVFNTQLFIAGLVNKTEANYQVVVIILNAVSAFLLTLILIL